MNGVQLSALQHHEDCVRLQARTSLIVSGQPADRFTQLGRVFFGVLFCVRGFKFYFYMESVRS